MRSHRDLQGELYDFATGRLSGDVRREMERHIDGCDECRDLLDGIRTVILSLPRRESDPADTLGESYWQRFADRVEERITPEAEPRVGILRQMADEVVSVLSRSWKPVWATAGAFALLVAGFLLIQKGGAPPESAPAPQMTAASPTVNDSTSLRVARYLQRSGTLLVGLANRKPSDHYTDLSVEQEISRGLVQEVRSLRGEPLDAQSTALLGDLERIMIEIANRGPEIDREHLDLIRTGIDNRNLLFKVRMTEELMTHKAQLQVASHER